MNRPAWLLVLALWMAATIRAGEPELLHVYDLDHPSIFQPHFANQAEWTARAEKLRTQVLVAQGLWPMPPRTPLKAVIHGGIDRDTYTIEKVFFASYPGHYVSGNLYLPKNRSGKLPAVLSPHGHWNNGRFYEAPPDVVKKQLAEGAESTEAGARFPLQARCAMLARMGCVVFQYDMVGYADSTQIQHRAGFTDAEAILRLQSFMGLQTWNSIRAVDFVSSLPQVDAYRIAITGASGGGTQTFILGAIDNRLDAEFPAVMVGEAMQGGCICENAPLLRIGTNNVEFAAMFAPKPLGMSAANDWTRAMESDALPKIRRIYSLFGKPQNVIGMYFNFEHNYNQVSREMMYTWLDEHFKLGWPSPAKEVAFEPVLPKDLSVYDEQHPRPADAVDAKGLRQYMTRTSEEQLAAMRQGEVKPYRALMVAALEVMVHDHAPLPADISVKDGALCRDGTSERLRFVQLNPKGRQVGMLIWADPNGPASLFRRAHFPTTDVQQFLDAGFSIICPELYLSGEGVHDNPATHPAAITNAGQHYAAFFYGYNRSVMAQRVHELLTMIAFARGQKDAPPVYLIARGRVAPAAMLAMALDPIPRRAAVDLGEFDSGRITDPTDEQMLPGLLKYGGIAGFAGICETETYVSRAANDEAVGDNAPMAFHKTVMSTQELIRWLLRP